MTFRKTIDQWSLKYFMLKNIWAKPVFNLYYKKIELRNSKIIPRHKPVIIAPNHQNALMDALAIVIKLPFQTIFMTRADIFKKPVMIKILNYMKMLPIYRMRDGISSLSKNEEVFDETTQILRKRNSPLCLFPEGNHGDKRRLRPLVKGIFRIAFQAQADYKDKTGVQIIPVGLDYKHYQKFRQTLFINCGQPIEVSEYWEKYQENQVVGINALRDRLADEMSKLMIDIQTEEYYDTYMGLREFYRPEMYKRIGIKSDKLSNRFDADKELIRILDKTLESNPEKIKTIDTKFKEYAKIRDDNNLRDWLFRKTNYPLAINILNLVGIILLSPLYLLGFINNWPHYFIPAKFVKKIKDTQFKSTAAWGMGMVIQAIYYIIIAIIAFKYMPFWWLALIYVVLLPFTGLVAYGIRNWFIKTMAKIRYSKNVKKSTSLQNAINLRIELIDLLNNLSR